MMEAASGKFPVEAYGGMMKSKTSGALKRTVSAVLIAGAILLLLGGVAGFSLWKVSDKGISADYNRNIKMTEESLEFNSESSPERLPTAAEDRTIRAGITAMKFPRGKCYIRSQLGAKLSEEAEIVTVKSNVDSLVWMTSEETLKDNSFLSPEILRFCGELPVYWQHPVNTQALRKRRSVVRLRRQSRGRSNQRQLTDQNSTSTEDLQGGSAFNPESPYHRNREGEETMTFDPMLDHHGICCSECRRAYTHCERVCEPLGGYYPWPYNYHGCRPVCRVIMPCRWWVARIMGIV